MIDLLEQTQAANGFSCKYCGEVFEKGCAIGGHISKRHPDVRERKMQAKANAVKRRRSKKNDSVEDADAFRLPLKSRAIRRAKDKLV